jgi:hypothetical protein
MDACMLKLYFLQAGPRWRFTDMIARLSGVLIFACFLITGTSIATAQGKRPCCDECTNITCDDFCSTKCTGTCRQKWTKAVERCNRTCSTKASSCGRRTRAAAQSFIKKPKVLGRQESTVTTYRASRRNNSSGASISCSGRCFSDGVTRYWKCKGTHADVACNLECSPPPPKGSCLPY